MIFCNENVITFETNVKQKYVDQWSHPTECFNVNTMALRSICVHNVIDELRKKKKKLVFMFGTTSV